MGQEGSEKPEGIRNQRKLLHLKVNGKVYTLTFGEDIEPWDPLAYDVYPWNMLAYTLREKLGLTGTKVACDNGACGSCTVLMDKKPVLSCTMLTADCEGKEIVTIEGLGDPENGRLDPVQRAFISHHGIQCGFCIPGMILSAKALLMENPSPTEEEVKEGLAGNLCRCGNYDLMIASVMEAAKMMRDEAQV